MFYAYAWPLLGFILYLSLLLSVMVPAPFLHSEEKPTALKPQNLLKRI